MKKRHSAEQIVEKFKNAHLLLNAESRSVRCCCAGLVAARVLLRFNGTWTSASGGRVGHWVSHAGHSVALLYDQS